MKTTASPKNEKPQIVEYKGYTLRKTGPFSDCYSFLLSNGEKIMQASLPKAKEYVDYLTANPSVKIR